MLTMIKLGGSLITDKKVEQAFRADVADRIAHEIAGALKINPHPVVIGHGSGSFGHFAAHKHGTIDGVRTPEQWRGFAEVALVASELNNLMARALWDADVPVWRIQPSALLTADDGVPQTMDMHAIESALEHGLVPLVYGDVGLDTVRGGTIISTESLFTHLATALPVTRILLVGEVPGVLDDAGSVIPLMTPDSLEGTKHMLKGSRGTDVTGGMLTKVTHMMMLVEQNPRLTIQIIDGTAENVLHNALADNVSTEGTTIRAN